MATLREIRRRISSIKSTQQITRAMKMVAAAKLRRAQENIFSIRPYADKLLETMSHLVAKVEYSEIPLLRSRPVQRLLLILVTADRGLCGGFNANLIRHTEEYIRQTAEPEVVLFPVGRKGYDYFRKRDYRLFDHKINFFNHLAFEDATDIIARVVPKFRNGEYDRIDIIYNEFKSVVQQRVMTRQLIPFLPDEEITEDRSQIDFLYEPSKDEILSLLIPKHLNIEMWRILLESNAAEQGARMTAMENATENAEDLIYTLSLTYNRARQAAITKEISEIVGGAEALKEK